MHTHIHFLGRRNFPQCQCGVEGDTSRTSPLQGYLTVLKVTVCHTAAHYGEEYDD